MRLYLITFLLLTDLNHLYATDTAPQIEEIPAELETVDGKDIALTCKTSGSPQPKVTWTRNGQTLLTGRYKILNNTTLHISNVQLDDSGQYTCYAENKFGNASRLLTFTVKKHTEVMVYPKALDVAAGMVATFHCEVSHDKNLDLKIFWLHNGNDLNTSNRSLTIKKADVLHSGIYTCYAETSLDQVTASGALIVSDVPNPPQLKGILCNKRDATISWMPMGDNRAPILHYIVEYNTSFAPNTWEAMHDQIPFNEMRYSFPMSPWANYTFRIVAVNKIGHSLPLLHSEVCSTSPDVPYRNPENVKAQIDKSNNLVISWDTMPLIEHNGPGFHYNVYWREDKPDAKYNTKHILDWQQNKLVIDNVPTTSRFKIKITAENKLGAAIALPKEVVGYPVEAVVIG